MIHLGDCRGVMAGMEPNSVDAIVTDPPAGISFMSKAWDHDKGGRKQWIAWMTDVMTDCLRVIKPGGHALIWALPRTSHWTATAIEDAGWEVRDICVHLFGSGFPKSLAVDKAIDKAAGAEREVVGRYELPDVADGRRGKGWECTNTTDAGIFGVSGQMNITAPATPEAERWQGWGTALKPAAEHWILCRKPLSEKGVAANVLRWGTGGINVDGCRLESVPPSVPQPQFNSPTGMVYGFQAGEGRNGEMSESSGRWPPNVAMDEEAARLLDEQSGERKSGGYPSAGGQRSHVSTYGSPNERGEQRFTASTGGASRFMKVVAQDDPATRFFYTGKASRAERNAGLRGMPMRESRRHGDTGPSDNAKPNGQGVLSEHNHHVTVKPLALMQWLVRMVTPPGGTVLDCFAGSGSTGVAAFREGFEFIGIEAEPEYVEIARARIAHAHQQGRQIEMEIA